MSNVIVNKDKIDLLANAISDKSGEPVTMTLDEMVEAVDNIKAETVLQSKSVNIVPTASAQTKTITADTGYDGLDEVDITVKAVPAGVVTGRTGVIQTSSSAVTYSTVNNKMIVYGYGVNTTPSLTQSGYVNGITSTTATVQVTTNEVVNPALSTSGATVTVPKGFYNATQSISVVSGTAGTPTATKGSVSNHSISVTPSVTNTEGYISGGTKTGDAVTVSASELVDGTYTVSQSGTADITNYKTLSVPALALPTSLTSSASGTEKATITLPDGNNRHLVIPSGFNTDQSFYTFNVTSGSEGTPTATKGTVSNHSVSVTPSVTNTAGYISGGTHTGTAVSVSASELVSGTYTVSGSGTANVTDYASISVPSGTAGTPTATKGNVSNHSITVTPSVTNQTGWITGGTTTGTGVTVTASELVGGNLNISQNGLYDVVEYSTVNVDVQGGGSGMQVGTIAQPSSFDTGYVVFNGLLGEPTSFVLEYAGNATISPNANHDTLVTVVYDGTDTWGQKITNTSNAQVSYTGDGVYYTYDNYTLTIVAVGGCVFDDDNPYRLTYTYGGSSTNIGTQQVQVGSGATSITFTNLDDEPDYFSCGFLGNFSTSSGYQRVISVVYDGTNIYGVEMDSGAKYSTAHWSYTYNNGSLTISSQGTNAGGYFHQPSSYQLTYGIGGDQSLQTKTVTPTQQTQNVTADTGYTALKKVVVNPIPSSYVQPTATQGATTYRAGTSQQTIASGTYLTGTQTIAPVSQTNLTAENIKSGTTISISNGQSNIWSVTGTYTGGGGGDKNVQISQSTTRNNASSLTRANGNLTVTKTGTYDVYWTASRSNTSTSYTWGSQLYVGGTAYGSENTTWSNNVQNNHLSNVSLTANQTVAVYTRGRSGSYYTYAPMLVIVEA